MAQSIGYAIAQGWMRHDALEVVPLQRTLSCERAFTAETSGGSRVSRKGMATIYASASLYVVVVYAIQLLNSINLSFFNTHPAPIPALLTEEATAPSSKIIRPSTDRGKFYLFTCRPAPIPGQSTEEASSRIALGSIGQLFNGLDLKYFHTIQGPQAGAATNSASSKSLKLPTNSIASNSSSSSIPSCTHSRAVTDGRGNPPHRH